MTARPPAPVAVGARAPGFTLDDQLGQPTSLPDLLAHRAALLVFLPFAFSRVCSGEVRSLQQDLPALERAGVAVVGITCDPMFSLRAWADAEGITMPLLSDFWPHGAVAEAYGVLRRSSGAAGRGTFLVDAQGVVRWTLATGPGEARDFSPVHEAVAGLARGEGGGAAPSDLSQ